MMKILAKSRSIGAPKRLANVCIVRISHMCSVSPVVTESCSVGHTCSPHPTTSTQHHGTPQTKSHSTIIPRHKSLIRDVPLLPIDGVVQFPNGPIKLRVSDASLNMMISDASSSRMVGIISQLSSTPVLDRDAVKKHLRSTSKSTASSHFNSDNFFERVLSASQHEFAAHGPNEVGLTDWRCADVGTLVQLNMVTDFVSSPASTPSPSPHSHQLSSGNSNSLSLAKSSTIFVPPEKADKKPSTQKTFVLNGTTLNRFSVRNYKRSLLGYWTADIELMREHWGYGGPKQATILMNEIQQDLPHILDMCDVSFTKELSTSVDPIHFSYILPKIFPSFGVSSLVSQAVLQSDSCNSRLLLERQVIRHIAKVFKTTRLPSLLTSTKGTTLVTQSGSQEDQQLETQMQHKNQQSSTTIPPSNTNKDNKKN
eukprot:c2478_g1_i1.p1 GENE.c2478_g1_i1~~c2478_g1_i1.p1  ORF type:complete len:425 (-),score=91.58 c2478_g1_i1:158-1432(-)